VISALVLGPWSGTGSDTKGNGYAPLVVTRYPCAGYADETGQANVPPNPNLTACRVTVTPQVFAQIEADTDLTVLEDDA
jgi:hypothetical protein